MTKEENKEDLSSLIYDLPECFMMTWEELMDKTSTTTTGYDIWNEVPKQENNQSSTNEGRHFKPPHLETDKPVEALNKST